jgi:hypothetical protein
MTTLNRTKRLLNDLVPETGCLPSLEDVRKSINDATLKRQSESKKAESKSQSRVPHLELGSVRSLPFPPSLAYLPFQDPSGPANLVHNLFQDLPPFDPTVQRNSSDTLTQAIDSHLQIIKVSSLPSQSTLCHYLLPLSSFPPGFSQFFVSPSERNQIGLRFRTVPL